MNFCRTPRHNINFLTTDDLKVLKLSFIITSGVPRLAVNLSNALINANAFMSGVNSRWRARLDAHGNSKIKTFKVVSVLFFINKGPEWSRLVH